MDTGRTGDAVDDTNQRQSQGEREKEKIEFDQIDHRRMGAETGEETEMKTLYEGL